MRNAVELIKEQRQGHEEMWKCSLEKFVDLVLQSLLDAQRNDNISSKEIKTAIGFLRMKFDKGMLAGTIEYEVSTAIEEAMIYHANVEPGL